MTLQASVSIRRRNLIDAFDGAYSGYPTTNVYVGAPRGGKIALSTLF